jgi:hypothetical protein
MYVCAALYVVQPVVHRQEENASRVINAGATWTERGHGYKISSDGKAAHAGGRMGRYEIAASPWAPRRTGAIEILWSVI